MSSSVSLYDSGDISRGKLSKLESSTDASTLNFIGQLDPFSWIIVGLTLGFYGLCFWLVMETLSTKSELQGLKNEVYGFKYEVQGFKHEVQGLKNEVYGFKYEVQSFKHEVQGFKHEIRGLDSAIQDLSHAVERLESKQE